MSGADASDKRWGTYHYRAIHLFLGRSLPRRFFEQAEKKLMIPSKPHQLMPSVQSNILHQQNDRITRVRLLEVKDVFGIEPDDWRRSMGDVLDEIKGAG